MIKLHELYQEILKENTSLSLIVNAINNHQIANLNYIGNDAPRGVRKVEVYALGTTKAGNKAIRAFQISGPTKTGNNEWKIFKTGEFDKFELTDETFDSPRPDFNSSGDKELDLDILASFKGKSFFANVKDKVKGAFKSAKDLFKFKKEGLLSDEDNLLLEQYGISHYDSKTDKIYLK
jgi:hypothetical protein